jgi:hypothetical protein
MMIHVSLSWPEIDDAALWLMALSHAALLEETVC